jgi:DNA-binding SARP family transcriptional activator
MLHVRSECVQTLYASLSGVEKKPSTNTLLLKPPLSEPPLLELPWTGENPGRVYSSMSWTLQVLGNITLYDAEKTLKPERRMVALLTYLALEGSTPRPKLSALLWPDSDDRTARNNLVQTLRRLKKVTGTDLITGEDALKLSDALEVDIAKLNVMSFQGNYQELLTLSGDLLLYDYDDAPEFSDWLFLEREKLNNLRREALSKLIEQFEKENDYVTALNYATTLLQLDPINEETYRLLMRLHYLSGNRNKALKTFEHCKTVLQTELGVEPMLETQQLAADIGIGLLESPIPKPQKTMIPLSVLRPPVLVGREDVWEKLETAWQENKVIFLSGEPGVGKSRLLKDFLDSKGAYTLFEGRPGDGGVPYSTQSRILRQVLNLYEVILGPWQRKELSRLLPELGETPEPLTSETDQLRFYEAQASVFQTAFEKGMKVIAVDDLQFFDEASFKALHFILGKHWGKPNTLQTVLSYRRNELNTDAETLLKDTVQGAPSIILEIPPLDERQVQDLVSSLGIADIEVLRQTLHGYTGGNPLFMIETIKSVLESGSMTLARSAKVQTLLQQRLDKLSQAALRLAWTAAVAQTDFSLELASHLMQQSPFDLAEPLLELEQRQIFMGERFSHDLIFETALVSITAPVKKYLHKQTAEFLEKQSANPARIANHYLGASDQSKALPFLEQAAETAGRDFQLIDAAMFAERIADILEAQNKPDEAFDYLKKARDWLATSSLIEKLENTVDLILKSAHSNNQRAESLHARAEFLIKRKGDFIGGETTAREGLPYADTPLLRSYLFTDIGEALWYQNRLNEALEFFREAVSIDRSANLKTLAASLSNLSLVQQYLGHYQEALKLQEESISLLRQNKKDDDLSVALAN